jgi:hypothetical protein
MIPDLIDIGSIWKVLPQGIHEATIQEIEDVFSTNDHRRHIFSGFVEAVKALLKVGCKIIYLDGSFVTGKPLPNDYDACWCPSGVNLKELDPVLLDFSNKRIAQKQKYYGELFPVNAMACPSRFFLDYFQTDRFTGKAKGIIRLNLHNITRR